MVARVVILALAAVAIIVSVGTRQRHHDEPAPTRAQLQSIEHTPSQARLLTGVPRLPVLPPLPRHVEHTHTPGTVSGVVMENGRPVANAQLHSMRLALNPRAHVDELVGVMENDQATDDAGHFTVDEGIGDFAIWATHDGHASSLLSPVSLAPGEAVDGIELLLTGSSRVSGIVVDDAGKQQRATIQLFVAGQLFTQQASRAAGFAMDDLPNEPIVVRAVKVSYDDRASQVGKLELPSPTQDIVLRLHAASPVLVVEVVDTHGAPAAHAWVELHSNDDSHTANADDGGHCSFTSITGKWTVSATSDDRNLVSDNVEVSVVDEHEQTFRVVVHGGLHVTGRVISADGHPMTQGMVSLDDGRGGTTMSSLDDEGKYDYGPLSRGHYALRYNPSTPLILGDLRIMFDADGEGERTLPDLRVPDKRHVRGIVLDEDGAPQTGVAVAIGPRLEDAVLESQVLTDDAGRFDVEAAGSIVLRASAEESIAAPVVASASGDEEITITLSPIHFFEALLRGAPEGVQVRCADGQWDTLAASGVMSMSCHGDDVVEARVPDGHGGFTTRHFPIEIDGDDESYAELKW